MKSIKIFRNYGVLAAEKRNVYTYGAEHSQAVCSDEITVEIPEGWETYENDLGQTMLTAPWGWNYFINEVLSGNKNPYFQAYDKDFNLKRFELKEI